MSGNKPSSTSMEEINSKTQLAVSNKVELLTFEVGEKAGLQFGINVFKVKEIVQRSQYNIDCVSSAGGHPHVLGLISHREGIIPVISLVRWIDGSHMNPNVDDKIVICQYNRKTIGLLINGNASIIRRDWSEIQECDFLKDGGKVNNVTLLKNTQGIEDKHLYILDVERLLDEIFPQVNSENLSNDVQEEIKRKIGKILVADDSAIARKHVKMTLDQLGATDYVFFENGQLLLDYLKQTNVENVGLVITDLEMPEVSGFIVVKTIKGDERLKDIPVIVNTSMSGENNIREANTLGADGFIAKTDIKELARIINEHAK